MARNIQTDSSTNQARTCFNMPTIPSIGTRGVTKRLRKLVEKTEWFFLSVGYAACHWCHVMERESFVDPEIARIMNERFRMHQSGPGGTAGCRSDLHDGPSKLISGNGGWPMSVFLLPDGKPFWGGTYFPARTGDRQGATGFLSIMNQIHEAWTNKPDAVRQQAEQLTAVIKANQRVERESGGPDTNKELNRKMVDRVASSLDEQFDPQFGGFGYSSANPNRPKFPEPSNLVFLLDRMQRESVSPSQRDRAASMLVANSGWHDQRIDARSSRRRVSSVQRRPHVADSPLRKNALRQRSTCVGFRPGVRGDRQRGVPPGRCRRMRFRHSRTRGRTVEPSTARSMRIAKGKRESFIAGIKTKSRRLPSQTEGGSKALKVFGIDQAPNFESEFYALSPRKTLSTIAKTQGETFRELYQSLAVFRQATMAKRAKRVRPLTDIKILTAWNGLMIAGLADAGRVLGKEEYLDAAIDAAEFMLTNLRKDDGRLLRSHAAGESRFNAYIDDYAFLASGLFALHRATGDEKWLSSGKEITEKTVDAVLG